MSWKKKAVDRCPKCGDTHAALHPGGRCYVCGEKTETIVRIDPKQPYEELVREFQSYFGQLAVKIGLEEARWLEDDFYSDIFDQRQPPPRGGVPSKAGEGRKEIVVYLPSAEP